MAFLLDTNSWIHYLKHASSPIRTRLEAVAPMDIVGCSIVKAELLHGAEKYGNRDRRVAAVLQTLAPFHSLPFDDGAAAIYAEIRHSLEVAGQSIGAYDMQIAAIGMLHGCIVVTHNVNEFRRVRGLQIEDWLQAP